ERDKLLVIERMFDYIGGMRESGSETLIEPRTLLEKDSGLDDSAEEAVLTGAHKPTGRLSTLEHLPTGTFHSLLLDSVDRTEHNGHDLVYLIQARVREISRLQAE